MMMMVMTMMMMMMLMMFSHSIFAGLKCRSSDRLVIYFS
jgi:hypothetical protein